MDNIEKKLCKKCGVVKPYNEFGLRKLIGRYYSPCKDCHRLASRERRKKMTKGQKILLNKKQRETYRNTPINYKTLRQNAKKCGRELSFTKQELFDWFYKQEQKCIYCEITVKQMSISSLNIYKKYNRLTIDRLDNNMGYALSNIGLACMVCNRTKSNIFTRIQMIQIGKLIASFYL